MKDIAIKKYKTFRAFKTHKNDRFKKIHRCNGVKAPRYLYIGMPLIAPTSTSGGEQCMMVQPSRPTCTTRRHDNGRTTLD
jgi:hypothetical protein